MILFNRLKLIFNKKPKVYEGIIDSLVGSIVVSVISNGKGYAVFTAHENSFKSKGIHLLEGERFSLKVTGKEVEVEKIDSYNLDDSVWTNIKAQVVIDEDEFQDLNGMKYNP